MNTEYTNQLIETINTVPDCNTLKTVAKEYTDQISEQISNMNSVLTTINTPDLEILAIVPTDLDTQIAWTLAYINQNVVPVVEQITTLTDLISSTEEQLALVTEAAIAKASQFTDCSIP